MSRLEESRLKRERIRGGEQSFSKKQIHGRFGQGSSTENCHCSKMVAEDATRFYFLSQLISKSMVFPRNLKHPEIYRFPSSSMTIMLTRGKLFGINNAH